MSATVAFDDHLRAIGAATGRMTAAALAAGPDAPVPTCPEWTVADLLAHQGMVHRWAHAHITATEPPFADVDAVLAEVDPDELPEWLAEGSDELVDALSAAPADLDAFVFIETGRTPLEFWARRQAHETTIHALDAISAARGEIPPPTAMGVTPAFAADGLDELVVSFLSRGRSKLYDGAPFRIVIAPDDTDHAWTLRVTESALTAERELDDYAEVWWSGAAAALYAGLWNRGGDITTARGDAAVLENWHSRHRIRGR
ncbi:maleylpyruvate isomerase family mycothiol-dependent enzyme [Williamsia sp.]|uniref:maleylpyruvate isomerase family mycothiol-dependent enzyme n=1 Tax=Williamsia sp. TaxID=1872085 RepID=UPI001A1AE69A|nr:maleylpyruvate isomerase family mycothiol-dependent enzyme [Williamsia sp.]MBJ7288495.1 maleylpyruvate isomerase family mycothiol-dependent enzyme [Williamsia sp.]